MAYTNFIKPTSVTQITASDEIPWNLDTSPYNISTGCSTTEPLTSFSSKNTQLLIFSGWDTSSVPPNNNLDAVFVDAFDVSSYETDPQGMTFNTDGTKMYVTGKVGDDVNEFTLTTGFDVSTASYDSKVSVAAQSVKPMGVQFNTDGTKMFILDEIGDQVLEYTVSVGFDIGPAITFVDAFSVVSEEANPRGFTFNTDGTKMFVTGYTGDDINEYTLSSAFDVSTASFVDNLSVSSQDSQARCVKFNTDGTKMFVLGSYNDSIYEYTVSVGFDISSTVTFVDSFDISSQEEDSNGLQFNNDGTKMFVVGDENGGDIYEYTLTTGFDVSTASYVDSLDVSSQETVPMGLTFNTDGTKMFVCGWTGDDINEYTLSTGFDISTASFVHSVSVSSQDTAPSSLEFNTDGTKMFVLGATGRDVNEYTLTTGFVISPITFVDAFAVGTQETKPTGFTFSADGTKMFVCGWKGMDVNEYTLTTGFDISTASFVDSFSVSSQSGATDPRDVKFSTDGTVMFVIGRASTHDSVYRYTLTTGFDVSTATYEDAFYVGDQETAGNSIAFNTAGTKMFVLGTNSDAVNEYTLSTAWDFSPVTTTVDGIEVKVLANKKSRIEDSIVQLAQSGSVIGTNQATSGAGSNYTYGDSSIVTPHTWDATLAYGDLPTLQVAVKYTSDDKPHKDTAYVYSVQLKIHYT